MKPLYLSEDIYFLEFFLRPLQNHKQTTVLNNRNYVTYRLSTAAISIMDSTCNSKKYTPVVDVAYYFKPTFRKESIVSTRKSDNSREKPIYQKHCFNRKFL